MNNYANVGESVLEAFSKNMFPDSKEKEMDVVKLLEATHDLTGKGVVLKEDGFFTSYTQGGPVISGLVLAERIIQAKRRMLYMQEAIDNMTAILLSGADK